MSPHRTMGRPPVDSSTEPATCAASTMSAYVPICASSVGQRSSFCARVRCTSPGRRSAVRCVSSVAVEEAVVRLCVGRQIPHVGDLSGRVERHHVRFLYVQRCAVFTCCRFADHGDAVVIVSEDVVNLELMGSGGELGAADERSSNGLAPPDSTPMASTGTAGSSRGRSSSSRIRRTHAAPTGARASSAMTPRSPGRVINPIQWRRFCGSSMQSSNGGQSVSGRLAAS
jgi:hypothetical protein